MTKKSFKDIELLLKKDINIDIKRFNYLIGINNKTKDVISNPLSQKFSELNNIKHMQISDNDGNDTIILLNEILTSLNNIELLCENYFNVILLGNSCVGKSSLIYRINENKYIRFNEPTFDFPHLWNTKTERKIQLKFIDTKGAEKFRSISLLCVKKADCAVLLYDMTNLNSFYVLKEWYQELVENENIKLIYIIENKIDLIDKAQVDEEEVIELAKENKLRFFKISCQKNMGIKEFLIDLCNEIAKTEAYGNMEIQIKRQNKKKKK